MEDSENNKLIVRNAYALLPSVSKQIAITNKILSYKTIVYIDKMDSVYRLLLDEIDEINKRVKIFFFKKPINAFNFITSNKVHMVISGNFYPQLHGITFLIAFKSLYPEVPFIVHSTIKLDDISHKKIADAFVLMSSDYSDLYMAINELLNDNKSTEEINHKIKIKDIDTIALLDKANNMLYKNTFAAEYYEEQIKKAPDEHNLHNYLGMVYLDSGMYEDSIEQFKQAIKLNKYVFSEFHYNLGVAYYKLGMYYESIEEFKKAIIGNRKYRAAYFHLSIVYLIIGQRKKAFDEYNNLKNIDPKIAEELLNIIVGNTKIETLDLFEYLYMYTISDMLVRGVKLKDFFGF